MNETLHHPSSFRDPSGFVFEHEGLVYRHIHSSYAPHYDRLISSGLYEKLASESLLIPHQEIAANFSGAQDWYKTLLPEQLPLISYPYEWCFDQLKDAALCCLDILRISLQHGMILKDATSFNFQWQAGRPLLVDSLSFVLHDPLKPWVAYRQFCETFLFPLLIGHYLAIDAQQWLSLYPEGIPVQMAAEILPASSRFSLAVWLQVYLQARISGTSLVKNERSMAFSRAKMDRLQAYLHQTIARLHLKKKRGHGWSRYYEDETAAKDYLQEKEKIFREMLEDIHCSTAIDLGANEGRFSEMMAGRGMLTLAVDSDSHCINDLYRNAGPEGRRKLYPLVTDLANPGPANGLRLTERKSFEERASADLACALALIHHLHFTRNIPLADIAALMAAYGKKWLIIEFVPLSDPQVRQLIAGKDQYHLPYDEETFEAHFCNFFDIERKAPIGGTGRCMYRMRRK